MRSALTLLLTLSACTTPPSGAPAGQAPAGQTPAGQAPAGQAPQTPGDRVPAALLGTYDEDAAGCAQGMTSSRLTVTPDTLDFFYGYAVVEAVREVANGVDVETTLYQTEGVEEVVPAAATYRLARARDGLRLESRAGGTSTLVRCREARSPSAPGSGTSGSGTSGSGVESAYTQIAGCETLEASEEGGSAVQRCPGVGGVPLYVSLGDLRYDVDAGVRNSRFETPSGFNALGRAVEWRLRGARPFAVIVRYDVEGPGGTAAGRRSDLAVIKVGRDGAPGCLIGYVPASATPDQNTAARRLADRDASGFDCEA